jgi:hypothetical protein
VSVEQVWAAVALLCLAGWAATLAALSRALLPMANALGALRKVDALVDERIAGTVQRLRERQAAKTLAVAAPPSDTRNADAARAAARTIETIFGPDAMRPTDEQPDPEGLEVLGV